MADQVKAISVLEDLPLDAIAVQETLNAAYEESRAWYEAAGLPSDSTPPRQQLSLFELDATVRLEFDRTAGFEIRLSPLGLGARIRHSVSRSSTMRISVRVTTEPLIGNPYESGAAHPPTDQEIRNVR